MAPVAGVEESATFEEVDGNGVVGPATSDVEAAAAPAEDTAEPPLEDAATPIGAVATASCGFKAALCVTNGVYA